MLSLNRLAKVPACVLLVVAAFVVDAGAPRAQDDETAEEVFHDRISGPIIQSKCVNCHVANGASGHTRLVFVRASDTADHEALNLRAFEAFLGEVAKEGGGTYVLNKIQGVAHGGGVQVALGSGHFANMERFLGLLGEPIARVRLTPETLFDTVVLASDRKTLRRAALIFAGRIPTDEEYAAVEGGDETALRATTRGLMEGPQFHEFLLRASNDRLLTDRGWSVIDGAATDNFVDLSNLYHQKAVAVSQGRLDEAEWRTWEDRVQFGFRRAPLELIAYVVENDRPYTEILIADFIMANPMAAEAYGAETVFTNSDDALEFRPSEIVSYYRDDESKVSEYSLEFGTKVTDPGDLWTIYPHAGILNTTAFLKRYPTTATNRNRARSRWTYYHFLGLDVEKSASRTTDPVALADTNNPTMHNPACTVCHSILDPVAGAFQNYGDEGFYRDQWGGLDSLDDLYKEGKVAAMAVQAESWEDRETLVWPLTLAAGTETLRVMYTNDFYDENTGEDGFVWLDRLTVVDAHGDVLVSHEFEDLEIPVPHWGTCGEAAYNHATEREDHVHLWNGDRHCAFFIDVEVPTDGAYSVEVAAWSIGYHEQYGNDGFARLSVTTNTYQVGDTWFRDMRTPGFDGKPAPNADNSVQWLARQIVADPRFAEATVKFWWPALMGREVARPPEDEADTGFEGQLLAANAQGAEVTRLAQGFRRGFHGGLAYNLKDLLVEIVLSKWFRADAVTDADPVRHAALRGAGAKRLLTPEELARKTAAIMGVQWGRHTPTHVDQGRYPSALTGDYRLLYGGIDSDGVTERSRDLTSVMAGVARRNAVQVSCPVVLREFYLAGDAERRLFAGIDPHVTPISEFSGTFEITAASRSEMQTFSLQGHLSAGEKTVSLAFLNDYWHETRGDRNILLDRLTVRQGNAVVYRYEIEDLDHPVECHHIEQEAFHLSSGGRQCMLGVPVNIPSDGMYQVEISAWGTHAGDELPRLRVAVESDAESSAGAAAIRSKLVELHDKLLGVRVAPDSPDVEAAYRLFVDVTERARATDYNWFEWTCDGHVDQFFFEGILDNVWVLREGAYGWWRWYEFDWQRVYAFLQDVDFSDPHAVARAWQVVLAYLMMDYRYLYLN